MASSGSDSSGTFGSDQVMNTRIMAISLIILAIVVLVFVSLHFYVRWMWVDASFGRRQWLWQEEDAPPLQTSPPETGLDKTILDALPTFIYSKESATEAMECSVCLAEFQENESTRLLPKCHHCFHKSCIDLWLQSHSTCPLCRTKLDDPSIPADQNPALPDEESSPPPLPPPPPPPHDQTDHQEAITIDIGISTDAADTSRGADSISRGEGLKKKIDRYHHHLDRHLVVDVPSRAAINPFDSTPGSTPRPSASPNNQSKASPLSNLRRILSTRERRSAISASPKGTAVDEEATLPAC